MQEIGPRFTLKLKWLKKGLPAVKNIGEVAKDLEFDTFENIEPEGKQGQAAQAVAPEGDMEVDIAAEGSTESQSNPVVPPKDDEYQWIWKVCF